MDDRSRRKATIAAALASAVAVATPITMFASVAEAKAITDQVRTYCRLEDGRQLVVVDRQQSQNSVEVFARNDQTGASSFLPDGTYRLDNGYRFQVTNGRVNSDWLAGDSGGFQQYHQQKDPWVDTAYPTATPDETDRIRFTDSQGRQFLVVQRGVGTAYLAYILDQDGRGTLASEGSYGTGDAWSSTFTIRSGGVVDAATLARVKLAAYEE